VVQGGANASPPPKKISFLPKNIFFFGYGVEEELIKNTEILSKQLFWWCEERK
jgi:hypothetical protein